MTLDTEPSESELQIATRQNNFDKVKDTLKRGLNPNELSLYQWAPLHEAISNENINIVKILLQNGADPNLPDSLQGNSPLHYAAQSGNLEILKLLVEKYSVDTNSRNMNGERPVDVAVKDCKVYLRVKGKEQLDDLEPHPSLDVFQKGVYENVFKASAQKVPHGVITDEVVGSSTDSMTPSIGSAHSSKDMEFQKSTASVPGIGNIKLRFDYSSNRSVLTIYPEEISDLFLDKAKICNLSHVYVKSYLLPDNSHSTKRKTELIKFGLLEDTKSRSRLSGRHLSKKMKAAFKKSSSDLRTEEPPSKVNIPQQGTLNMIFERCLVYKGVTTKNSVSRTIQVSVCGKPTSTVAKTRILGSVVIPVAVAMKKSQDKTAEWYPLSMFIGPVACVNKEVESQLNNSWEKSNDGNFTGRSLAWSGSGSREFAFTRTLPETTCANEDIGNDSREERAYSGKYSRHYRRTNERMMCQELNDEDDSARVSHRRKMTSSHDFNERTWNNSYRGSVTVDGFDSGNNNMEKRSIFDTFIVEKSPSRQARPMSLATSPVKERTNSRMLPRTIFGGVPAPVF